MQQGADSFCSASHFCAFAVFLNVTVEALRCWDVFFDVLRGCGRIVKKMSYVLVSLRKHHKVKER